MENKMVEHIVKALDNVADSTITVFGDFCLDKYLYIDAERDEVSVETGLVAYQVHEKKMFPGAGGTVTNNLRALGANVYCVGLCGEDGEGYELLKKLEKIGANTEFMVKSPEVQTSTYIKPMRKIWGEPYKEMNRMDVKNFRKTSERLEEQLIQNLEKALLVSRGVVVLEQFLERNCATVTDYIREELEQLSKKYPEKFFYVDSRGYSECYREMIVKCNQYEIVKSVGEEGDNPENIQILKKCGESLSVRNGKPVVVTMGEQGSYVFENHEAYKIPSFLVKGPIDIVGAGDATNAGIILGLTLGLTLQESAMLGGCISSITIQQIGVTGTATVEQVKKRLVEVYPVSA